MWGSNNSRTGGHSYDRVPTEDDTSERLSSSSRSILKERIAQQDDSLGILESSIQKLGVLSLNISTELKEQNKMLDSMTEDVEDAQNQVDILTRKTKELINKSGGPKYFLIIVVLIVILIILIFLVIYL